MATINGAATLVISATLAAVASSELVYAPETTVVRVEPEVTVYRATQEVTVVKS